VPEWRPASSPSFSSTTSLARAACVAALVAEFARVARSGRHLVVEPGFAVELGEEKAAVFARCAHFGGIAPQGPFQSEQVAAWLDSTAPGPFLVIFDDLWHPAPLRLLSRALPPQAVQLVTTRFANTTRPNVPVPSGFTLLNSPSNALGCQNAAARSPEEFRCRRPNSQSEVRPTIHKRRA